MTDHPTRRRLLVTGATATLGAAVTGCLNVGGGGDDDESGDGGSDDGGSGGDGNGAVGSGTDGTDEQRDDGGERGTATDAMAETDTTAAPATTSEAGGTATTTDAGSGTGGCQTPTTEDLESLVPPGGDKFKTHGGEMRDSGMGGMAETEKMLQYVYNDTNYFFGAGLFASESDQRELLDALSQNNQEGDIGYVAIERYVFLSIGGDRETMKELLAMSPALTESCVESRITYPE